MTPADCSGTLSYVCCFDADTDQVNEFYKLFRKMRVHGRVKSLGTSEVDHNAVCDAMIREVESWRRS